MFCTIPVVLRTRELSYERQKQRSPAGHHMRARRVHVVITQTSGGWEARMIILILQMREQAQRSEVIFPRVSRGRRQG